MRYFNQCIFVFAYLGLISLFNGTPNQDNTPIPFQETQLEHLADTLLYSGKHALFKISIDDSNTPLVICNLSPKASYKIKITNKSRESNCYVKLTDDLNRKEHWEKSAFQPSSNCKTFHLIKDQCNENEIKDLLIYQTDEITEEKLMDITTTVNEDASFLIEDVFISGGCFEVSNPVLSGITGQVGTFSMGTSTIGLDEGIVLSTGNITDIPNPLPVFNNFASSIMGGSTIEPDLSSLVTQVLNDVVVLEFDFVPQATGVSFQYVFASEEYPDFVCSDYNDVFGFFISGPGFAGNENIAFIPGTTTPVAINTVNSGNPGDFYYSTGCPAGGLGNSSFYVDNCDDPTFCFGNNNPISFDGFTTVFEASAEVVACETYHIKLAIADAGDSSYDSAVFLAANSFDAGGGSTVSSNVPSTSSEIAFEGCSDGVFTFTRTDLDDLTTDLVFEVIVSGTAIEGVDYTFSPATTTITIPAGQTEFNLNVNVIADGIVEGDETIILELEIPCTCTNPFAQIIIQDGIICDDGLCSTEDTFDDTNCECVFTPLPPIDCNDNNACTTDIYDVVTCTCSYVDSDCSNGSTSLVPCDDANDCTENDMQTILDCDGTICEPCMGDLSITPIPSVESQSQCAGENVETFIVIGQGEEYNWYDNDPASTSPISNGMTYLPILDNSGVGTYNYWVTAIVNGCESEPFNFTLTINPLPTAVLVQNTETLDCFVSEITLDGSTTSGINLEYQWLLDGQQIPGETDPIYIADAEGVYTFIVIDTDTECLSESSVSITDNIQYPLVEIETPSLITCDDSLITLNGSSSTQGPDIVYQWLDGNGEPIAGATESTYTTGEFGMYTLAVTDATNECSNDLSITVETDFLIAEVDAGEDIDLDCFETEVQLSGNVEAPLNSGPYIINWTGENILQDGNSTTPTVGLGAYTIEVTNTSNGCTTTDEVMVTQLGSPIDAITSIENPECYEEENGLIVIDEVIGGTPPYAYAINGESFGTSNAFLNLGVGDYDILIQDANGCELSISTISITGQLELLIAATGIQIIEYGEDLTLEALPNFDPDTIIWTTSNGSDSLSCYDCLNPSLVPLNDSYYYVQMTDENGCAATAQLQVVVSKERNVFIPNSFSPNEDGVNDQFTIYSDDKIENIRKFEIYDRWGELVFRNANFQPNEPSEGWDGNMKSKKLNPAVFVYWIEVEFIDGVIEIYKGDILLSR